MTRYWLNSPDKLENPDEFERRSGNVCQTYAAAPELHEQGTHTVGTDEKTGMQALERAAPTLPMKPGLIERQEADYVRHGTKVLTANFEVARGKVICPTNGYLYHVPTNRLVPLGHFPAPRPYVGEFRCDTHPRSDPTGTKVVIDSAHHDGRQMYLIDVAAIVGRGE